jgi:integrase
MAHRDDEEPQFQILYKLEGGAGLRLGEGCGRRFRDIRWDAPVMPALHVWSQYQDEPLKTARGEDTKERMAPLSSWLANDLRHWKLSGFAERYGRPPKPEDFIVPDPATMQAYKRGSRPGKRPREVDCPAVGIPNKGNHGLRRYFITQARRGGARPDMLEKVTHNKKGVVLDLCTDAEGIWPALCEAVLCHRVEWPEEDNVRLFSSSNGHSNGH